MPVQMQFGEQFHQIRLSGRLVDEFVCSTPSIQIKLIQLNKMLSILFDGGVFSSAQTAIRFELGLFALKMAG